MWSTVETHGTCMQRQKFGAENQSIWLIIIIIIIIPQHAYTGQRTMHENTLKLSQIRFCLQSTKNSSINNVWSPFRLVCSKCSCSFKVAVILQRNVVPCQVLHDGGRESSRGTAPSSTWPHLKIAGHRKARGWLLTHPQHMASEATASLGNKLRQWLNAGITCQNQCAAYLVRVCVSHLSERHEGQQTHLKTRRRRQPQQPLGHDTVLVARRTKTLGSH